MPHIHTKPGQHDFTASAYIVRIENDEPVVLIHMHKKLGMLLQPGGHVELHETPWQAVLHEIEEETGYDSSQLHVLQPKQRISLSDDVASHPLPMYIQTHDFPGLDHFHTDIGFVFFAKDLPANKPSDGESTELSWVSNDDLRTIADEKMYKNTRRNIRFALDVCAVDWEALLVSDFPS